MPAKHPRKGRKRDPNFVVIPFNQSQPLLTLDDNTALIANILGGVFTDDFYPVSMDGLWSIRDLTSGEAPIQMGVAHGDLSAAEIVAALDVSLLGKASIIETELASRPVRRVGQISTTAETRFNDGKQLRTKIRFRKSLGVGSFLGFWAVNRSGATLTTGAIQEVSGNLYGRWV